MLNLCHTLEHRPLGLKILDLRLDCRCEETTADVCGRLSPNPLDWRSGLMLSFY